MDIALILDFLVPSARYSGCFNDNTQEEYDAIEWEDSRPKPSWSDVSECLSFGVKLKKAELATARWEQETGGITLPGGVQIKTDRESQSLLTGAALSSMLDPETPVEWKGANGWVILTSEQVIQIAGAVRQHVQTVFSKEKTLNATIDSIVADESKTTFEKISAIQAITW